MAEVLAHPIAGPILQDAMAQMTNMLDDATSIMPEGVDMMRMVEPLPVGRIGMGLGDGFSPEMLDHLLATANTGSAQA